jgi:hypothetical protein
MREARRSIQFQLDYDIRFNHRNAIKGAGSTRMVHTAHSDHSIDGGVQ